MRVLFLIFALLLLAPAVQAQDLNPPDSYTYITYKGGEDWPGRNFNGLDFLEPFAPATAFRRGDVSRIFYHSAIPYAFLLSSFAIDRPTDLAVSHEIARWGGLELDAKLDTYGVLMGGMALGFFSILLPAPEDAFGYSWNLRLDRLTVYALGCCLPAIEREITAPIWNIPRPDGSHYTSVNDARPSGHTAAAYASAAFLAHTLRDWLEPERETNVFARIGKEALLVLPYLPPVYVILERIKTKKHTLVDCLVGAGMGAFTMELLYSWSFNRREQGMSWVQSFELSYDPGARGYMLALSGTF